MVEIKLVLKNRIIIFVHASLYLIFLIVPSAQRSHSITHCFSETLSSSETLCSYFRQFRSFSFLFRWTRFAFCFLWFGLLGLSHEFLVSQFKLVNLTVLCFLLLIATTSTRHLLKFLQILVFLNRKMYREFSILIISPIFKLLSLIYRRTELLLDVRIQHLLIIYF